eukprot:m.184702 g.184702  ORF g.184702 m.184702 type:complete len:558 (-) comp18104_c0_seq1:140-1813(-)
MPPCRSVAVLSSSQCPARRPCRHHHQLPLLVRYSHDCRCSIRVQCASFRCHPVWGNVTPSPTMRFPRIPVLDVLSWYETPPYGVVELEQAEEMMVARLRVLQDCAETRLDRPSLLSRFSQRNDDLSPLHSSQGDCASHFLLRLALSQSREARYFFVQAETALFETRLAAVVGSGCRRRFWELKRVCMAAGLDDRLLRRPGKESLRRQAHAVVSGGFLSAPVDFALTNTETNGCDGLLNALVAPVAAGHEDELYLCLPFEAASCFLRKRDPTVVLKRGKAYVPRPHWPVLLRNAFTEHIQKGVERARAAFACAAVGEDDRLVPVMTHALRLFERWLQQSSAQLDLPQRKLSLNLSDVDTMARLFPPCMALYHANLRKNHHLKHEGRLVYTLFLKGAGMGVQDQIKFWESEFRQVMSEATIRTKRYRYSIRHLYGLEGSRIDRAPYKCAKIISDFTCPFASFDALGLRAFLKNYLPGSDAPEAQKLAARGRFSEACRCTFDRLHAGSEGGQDQATDSKGGVANEQLCKPLFSSPQEFFRLGLEVSGAASNLDDDASDPG